MWLDRPNAALDRSGRVPTTSAWTCPPGPFESVGLWAPPPRPEPRNLGVPCRREQVGGAFQAYYWTVRDFVRERMLRFLFAEAEDERSPTRRPGRACGAAPGARLRG